MKLVIVESPAKAKTIEKVARVTLLKYTHICLLADCSARAVALRKVFQ